MALYATRRSRIPDAFGAYRVLKVLSEGGQSRIVKARDEDNDDRLVAIKYNRTPEHKYLLKQCSKDRLIEMIYDFVLFDGGVKKLPRVHQYFGIKAAQEYIRQKKGGVIWHTQGSGG